MRDVFESFRTILRHADEQLTSCARAYAVRDIEALRSRSIDVAATLLSLVTLSDAYLNRETLDAEQAASDVG